MKQENITINFFPIDIVGTEIPVFVSKKKSSDYIKSFTPQQLTYLSELKIINREEQYWDFFEFTGSKPVLLDANREFNIVKKYVGYLIHDYFLKSSGVYVNRNFIGSTEVYERLDAIVHNHWNLDVLRRFSIRCEYWYSAKRYGIIVSQGRKTYCTQKPCSDFIERGVKDKINRVLFKNKVSRYTDFINDPDFDDSHCYLLRTGALGDIFPQVSSGIAKENPYPSFREGIIQFVKNHLFEKTVGNFVTFSYSSLMSIPPEDIFRTPIESNLLSFKNGQTSPNVYNGLKEYGPVSVPEEAKNVKFFFIFHESDKVLANKLFSYFSKGYRGFPGFAQFIGIPVTNANLDVAKTIKYTADNPAREIIDKINGLDFSGGKFAAFYLSRIKRDEQNPSKKIVYYQVKEALLKKGVVSQVIFRDNIDNEYYNFHLPNIAIALLAKLSGIPWKLASPSSSDLIIGIGADRRDNNVYFGNTICFKNDGTFEEFDAFVENALDPLGESFKKAIKKYTQNNQDAKRIVIHFYKQMSRKEEKRLLEIFSDSGINVPYVVLNITENSEKDYVLFDEKYDALMPVSGTYVKIRNKVYVLANNQRYENAPVLKITDFPFPVKIWISKSRDVDLKNFKIVNDLIYQVYQFSRIYWRSIRQKSKPVTILYSEKIAEMASYFENGKLPEHIVSHKTLWFL